MISSRWFNYMSLRGGWYLLFAGVFVKIESYADSGLHVIFSGMRNGFRTAAEQRSGIYGERENDMAVYYLKNKKLSICADSFGAELRSLKKLGSDTEYMWDRDPAYWEGTSPLLFPFVGSLKNGSYRYGEKVYPMIKHGFAKDREFELLQQTENELRFILRADAETRKNYPFDFELEVGYRFDKEDENKLIVSWKVTNCGSQEMYFSIGGHPAFRCPPDGKGVLTDCRLQFDTKDKIVSSVVGEGSLLSGRTKEYALRDGMMDITEGMFDADALVIEQDQAHQVSICDGGGQPFVTVNFDAPLLVLWAPAKKNVPFLCIEPCYGRCDREDFAGDLSRREYENRLVPSGVFYAGYTITIS